MTKSKSAEKIAVVLDQTTPEPTEIIAASIIKISEGFAKLQSGGLNRRALIVLIKDYTNVPNYQIEKILNCLPALKDIYCVKANAK